MTRNMIRLAFALIFVVVCVAAKHGPNGIRETTPCTAISLTESGIHFLADGTTPVPPLCPSGPFCRPKTTQIADGTTPYPPLCPKGRPCLPS